ERRGVAGPPPRGVSPLGPPGGGVALGAGGGGEPDPGPGRGGGWTAHTPFPPPPPAMPAQLARQPRLAIPAEPEFHGDAQAQAAYERSLDALRTLGATLHPIDFAPFRQLADLLYPRPWITERYAAVRALHERAPATSERRDRS